MDSANAMWWSTALKSAAFWISVGFMIFAAMWREVAIRREAEITLRLAIERGQQISPALIEQILRPKKDKTLLRAVSLLAAGVGLPLMGYVISFGGDHELLYPMMGVGVLLGVLGAAQFAVWKLTAHQPTPNPTE